MPSTNIQFNYLYRDVGNYKAFSSEVFSNPSKLNIKEIEERIRIALIDEQFFDPLAWGITRLEIAEWDDELDHEWHEFLSVERTGKLATKSILQLLSMINHESKNSNVSLFEGDNK